MTVSSTLSMAATVQQTKTLDLTTTQDELNFRRAVQLSSGTAAGQADKVFHDRRTLTASATEDLDLAGVLLDAFGGTITFVKIKGLFVAAAAGNTNSVVIGAAAATPWAALLNSTGTLTLRPGASFGAFAGAADAAGYAVGAGTADLLKVANSGAGSSVTYDVVIVGTSA
ncbi:hypothetical protein DMB38_12775 [Streptomyces sp. WAC 06738]|uniref:hypothetical protein n=1 Tax=Streptomyces sp. WAC 06738 TaxID=2203210 RepID=UPI000F6DDC08|nr:hypothetical protein [Streptomyces sp. WAC 06738]AZM46570.1 hypothetical protein DMB38_12775 [Streptomyces sp. WAC 06738]